MGRGARVGLFLLAFTPALAGAFLVAENAVDVPLAEDWARAGLLEPGLAGSDFALAPIPPIPRLAARANARWFGGDLTLDMAFAFGLVLLAAFCVHGLLRRTFPDDAGALYANTFVANLLLFSPIQWESFLWSARAWSFLPFAALCAGLLALGSRWPNGWKVATGALLAAVTAATVPLSAFFAASGERAGLTSLPSLLGSPFARTSLLPAEDLAPAMGVLVAAFFVAGAAYCGALGRDSNLRRRAVPWLIVGGFSFAACALTLWVVAGAEDTLLSRHATLSLYVCLAALPLLALGVAHLRGRTLESRPALCAVFEWAPAFGLGILVVAIGLGWLVGLRGMQEWKSARLQARTSLVFLERFAPVHRVRLGGTATLDALRRAARVLDRHGQLRPALAGDEGFGPFALDGSLAAQWGDIESAWTSGAGLDLGGFAWFADSGRCADGVLVTARIGEEPRRVIAVAELQALLFPPIPDHDHIYNHARIPRVDERAAWRVRVPLQTLPQAPEVRIEAFAADSEALQLHRLTHEVVLRRTPAGPSAELAGSEAP